MTPARATGPRSRARGVGEDGPARSRIDAGRSLFIGVRHYQTVVLSVLTHGATGTWLDEIVEFGLPLVILIALYIWSSRKPKAKQKAK